MIKTALITIADVIEKRLNNIKKSNGYNFNMHIHRGDFPTFSTKEAPYCYFNFGNDSPQFDEYGRQNNYQEVQFQVGDRFTKKDMLSHLSLLHANVIIALDRDTKAPRVNDKSSSRLGKLVTKFNYGGGNRFKAVDPDRKSNIWVGCTIRYDLIYRTEINDPTIIV